MKKYDNKDWARLTFVYHGTVLPRIWRRLLAIALIALAVQLLSLVGIRIPKFESLGHTLIGLSLGLLIVFRNNSSYDRYWDGRKSFGAILNAGRSLVRAAVAYTNESKEMATLVTAYVVATKSRLRGETATEKLQEILAPSQMALVHQTKNVPLAIGIQISTFIHKHLEAGIITPEQTISMENLVTELSNNLSACDRIRNTPIPFCHAAHINQLLFIYLATLPLVLVPVASWTGIAISVIIAFGLIGIDAAGIEIEDPFGRDLNDLPIDDLCASFEYDVEFLVTHIMHNH